MDDLRKIKTEIQDHVVKLTHVKIVNGKVTDQLHIRAICPNEDVSNDTQEIQDLCAIARVGYIKPQPPT